MKHVIGVVSRDFSEYGVYNTLSLLCEEKGFVYNTLIQKEMPFWHEDLFIFKTEPKVKPNARTLNKKK